MSKIYYIIKGHSSDEHDSEEVHREHSIHIDHSFPDLRKEIDASDLPYEKEALEFMAAKGYSEYVKKHGYHFTDSLAEHVSKMMVNADGSKHSWTAAQVSAALSSLGAKLPETTTLGDATYLANMYYADLFPEVLKEELSCVKAAAKIAKDVDGYKGMVFSRWTSDAIGKSIHIDWEKFI